MGKDFFQRNVEVMNDLRTEQFKVREYLQRGKYRMKQKFFNKGKKHYDFDLNSQEYFHEQLYDLSFESSEVQEQFNALLAKLTAHPPRYRSRLHPLPPAPPPRRHQLSTRLQLHRFFNNRALDLQYEKYQLSIRLHNAAAEEEMPYVRSRMTLIDKEIQMAIARADRLSCEDHFEETYTVGGKPVPVNENGQSIYKYLEEEDCWYSNIHRDDVLVYSRFRLFRRELLQVHYLPLHHQFKSMVGTQGLDLVGEAEEEMGRQRQAGKERVLALARQLVEMSENELEQLSPGNLVEKENISSFLYSVFGVDEKEVAVDLPLHPSLYCQLIASYNQTLPLFFKSLEVHDAREIAAILPKLSNFCAIVFKYQNKEILQGKPEIKLGLQDDIDIRKQLHTMLQQAWVSRFVKTDFDRFDYRCRLTPADWPLDSLSSDHLRQHLHAPAPPVPDAATKELIALMRSTNYGSFRKHIKRRAEMVVGRAKSKFTDMEQANRYASLSHEEQTLEQLGALFRIKFNEKDLPSESLLKEQAGFFFSLFLKKHLLASAVEVEVAEMLRAVRVRESRTQLCGLLNGMRCYHRNLAMDLRAVSGMEFKFQLDDELLINSNKQAFENFEKAVKDTQSFFSKDTRESQPLRLTEQQFQQHQDYSRPSIYKRDRVTCHFYGETVPHVLVSSGRRLKQKVLYEPALQDLEQVESRLLATATSYINRYERYLKVKSLDELVDRMELLTRLYGLELQYQWEKFQLVEAYYYAYENTKEPLQAYKLSRTILALILKPPAVDLSQTSFEQSYRMNIEALKTEAELVRLLTHQLERAEEEKCRVFHDKLARTMSIPLTLQAFLYGDLEKRGRGTGTKMQRMNSMTSKLSKESRNENKLKPEMEIREHVQEEDSDEESFDLENYDEYLLRKNMDAIFDDMIGGDENGHLKEASPVNTVALENIVVNPRFEGGPHIRTKIHPELPVTSQKRQHLVNFSETLYVVGNIRQLVESLREEFEKQFGYCCELYQLVFMRQLTQRMLKDCLQPEPLPPRWLTFETDDAYLETVTKSMRYYEETMAACLEPPSNVQLAIPATHERHHDKLPLFGALQYFDYHSIHSLVQLKKPINAFRYKEHNLGLNFLELLELEDRLWEVQLQRRGLSRAYQSLGRHCELTLEKSLTEYTNSGQSEVFMSTQEVKMYNPDIARHAVFSDMLQEIRGYLACELADVELFSRSLELARYELEDLVLMRMQLERRTINGRLDLTRMLAPNDPKDVKKVRNRIVGVISARATGTLKHNNFLKLKTPLKLQFESKMKEIAEYDYDSRIVGREKLPPVCINLLTAKYRRLLQVQLLKEYTNDLLLTASKQQVATENCALIGKLHIFGRALPFLSNLLILPNQDKTIDSKVLYDQAKTKRAVGLQDEIFKQGELRKISYVYTREQFLEEWRNDNLQPLDHSLRSFDCSQKLSGLEPPASKELIFKWAFSIPDCKVDPGEKDALRHFTTLLQPFTGRLSQSDYREGELGLSEPPRDKYLTLREHYRGLVDYIEASVLLISLQVEDSVLQSLEGLMRGRASFEERYALVDENSIRETIETLENQDLAVVYKFVVNLAEVSRQVGAKMEARNYLEKKEHWVVHDQVIDFVMSRVQGYGLLRQSFLPLHDDLRQLFIESKEAGSFLAKKTGNIYRLLQLATYQTYLNEINEESSDFYAYQRKLTEWLTHSDVLQDYTVEGDLNARVNILPELNEDEFEKERFSSGIYHNNNNTLVAKLRHVVAVLPLRTEDFFRSHLHPPPEDASLTDAHNPSFIWEGLRCLSQLGEQNRLKLFARVRYHFDLVQDSLSTRPSQMNVTQRETWKCGFLDLQLSKKVLTLSCVAFSGRVRLPVCAKEFKESYMELKEVNQINTHSLYENLEQFKEENKIQFSKGQTALIGRNEGMCDSQHNRNIREVLSCKLLREEFRYRVLSEAIRILRAERLPRTEPKRILNTSLIPRVHLISSYSSPLMTERKTYISQQYKLSFLQAFINRFRNKVSRVDLLSSGYGFVITVPDLEDCVNYMNKLLFTFTEKEFKNRIETFSQYYEILIEAINEKNKTINEQAALIRHLQAKNSNLLEAEYLSKVTKLLHQKTLVEDQLQVVQNNINGLEDRVRKVVQLQYEKKIDRLEKENEELKQIFSRVKHLHMTNTKEAAKNDYLDIVNYYREKLTEVLNKKVDFSISFEEPSSQQKSIKVAEEDASDKYRQAGEEKYTTEDLQRCKMGEDILFDPYYATKLINKMRLFNLFKLGSRRIRFEEEQFRKQQKLGELHKIQDAVVAQSERESLLRNELARVQEELSRKCLDLEKVKQNYDAIDNEKTKLKILMQSKDKKIEQKDRELEELRKKMDQKPPIPSNNTSERQKPAEPDEAPRISALRRDKKIRKHQRAFLTNIQVEPPPNSMSLYQRFQLSSKDSTWRQKCEQLYVENKRLQAELQRQQGSTVSVVSTPQREGYSLNMRKREVQSRGEHKFPNISFKYNILKQSQY